MRLSTQQLGLLTKHSMRPKVSVTVKWCTRCGGTHSGPCDMVTTIFGTRCRSDIVALVESRGIEQGR